LTNMINLNLRFRPGSKRRKPGTIGNIISPLQTRPNPVKRTSRPFYAASIISVLAGIAFKKREGSLAGVSVRGGLHDEGTAGEFEGGGGRI